MAKERSDRSKEERKASKKVKKEAALGPTESAGVVKSSSDKAEKKEKKGKREALAERALNEIGTAQKQTEEDESDTGEEGDGPGIEADGMAKGESGKGKGKEKRSFVLTRPTGALVPFANPLAVEEKTVKKIFKSVKKAAAQRGLKRGVKEVVKAVRRSPTSQPASSALSNPIGVVILAADISPMDVISHIPVLCEDHNIPYVYVKSRAELGMASQTKRPTSVVMVNRDLLPKKSKDSTEKKDDAAEDWPETYKSLVKVVEKEGRNVKR